jgi:hypothetical protein
MTVPRKLGRNFFGTSASKRKVPKAQSRSDPVRSLDSCIGGEMAAFHIPESDKATRTSDEIAIEMEAETSVVKLDNSAKNWMKLCGLRKGEKCSEDWGVFPTDVQITIFP